MKAIHLAAGQGTRLRPLTDDRPKPLVELAGTSLLERNIETLRNAGVDEHVAVTGYEAEQIDTLAAQLDFETIHNHVYDETEMIYSLFCARDVFPGPDDGDLIISYGDIIYDEYVVRRLLACDAPLCVVVDTQWRQLWAERFDDPLEDAETLDIDDSGIIRSIGETPNGYDEIDAQYTGLFKVQNDHIESFVDAYHTLDMVTDGHVSIDATAFLQRLIDDGWHVQSVPVASGWLEVDTLEDLQYYRGLHEADELSRFVSL